MLWSPFSPTSWWLFSIGYLPFLICILNHSFSFVLAASHQHLDMLNFPPLNKQTNKQNSSSALFLTGAISCLPSSRKLYQKWAVYTCCLHFLTSHSKHSPALSPTQSGFSDPRTPLLTALVKETNDILIAKPNEQSEVLIFLELSAADNINDCPHTTSVLMPLLKVPTPWLCSCCSSPYSPHSSWLLLPVPLCGLFSATP